MSDETPDYETAKKSYEEKLRRHRLAVTRKAKQLRDRRHCSYPGGCPNIAITPNVYCLAHREEDAAAIAGVGTVDPLERLVGAVRDYIWNEDSRVRRKLKRSATTHNAYLHLRAALTMGEMALRHTADELRLEKIPKPNHTTKAALRWSTANDPEYSQADGHYGECEPMPVLEYDIDDTDNHEDY